MILLKFTKVRELRGGNVLKKTFETQFRYRKLEWKEFCATTKSTSSVWGHPNPNALRSGLPNVDMCQILSQVNPTSRKHWTGTQYVDFGKARMSQVIPNLITPFSQSSQRLHGQMMSQVNQRQWMMRSGSTQQHYQFSLNTNQLFELSHQLPGLTQSHESNPRFQV